LECGWTGVEYVRGEGHYSWCSRSNRNVERVRRHGREAVIVDPYNQARPKPAVWE
jgi:hypothetical protein